MTHPDLKHPLGARWKVLWQAPENWAPGMVSVIAEFDGPHPEHPQGVLYLASVHVVPHAYRAFDVALATGTLMASARALQDSLLELFHRLPRTDANAPLLARARAALESSGAEVPPE